jgi:hypothetical protein
MRRRDAISRIDVIATPLARRFVARVTAERYCATPSAQAISGRMVSPVPVSLISRFA